METQLETYFGLESYGCLSYADQDCAKIIDESRVSESNETCSSLRVTTDSIQDVPPARICRSIARDIGIEVWIGCMWLGYVQSLGRRVVGWGLGC